VRRGTIGSFKSEQARVRFLSVYQATIAQLPPVTESTNVPTSFGTVRACLFDGPSYDPPVVGPGDDVRSYPDEGATGVGGTVLAGVICNGLGSV